jgi:hypothetical protein
MQVKVGLVQMQSAPGPVVGCAHDEALVLSGISGCTAKIRCRARRSCCFR